MAWTDPVDADWQTDDIPTETQIKQQVLDDLRHLRGQDGITSLEGDQNPLTDNVKDLGSALKRWAEIYGVNIYAGRYKASPNIREVRVPWEDSAPANYQVTFTATGGGSVANAGGFGQMALKVDNDAGGARSADIRPVTEQASTLSNHWDRGKKPYFRLEFSLNAEDANCEIFIGFRATPGLLTPTGAEHHAGLWWDGGANWRLSTGGGATSATNLTTDPTAGARHVLELYITASGGAATGVELWLDGVLQITKTTNLPAADMKWQILLSTDGLGAGSDSIMTIGELIIQEELA